MSKLWPCTIFTKHMTVEETSGQRGGTREPTLGPADPTGRPTQGQWLLGPTFSNGSMTVVLGFSSGALDRFSLNRGRERGVELSHVHTLTHTPSHKLCSGFHWILAQVSLQENSLSHFFVARLPTHLKEQHSGKSFISISQM